MTQPGLAPGTFRRTYVETVEGLREAVTELAQHADLGVDLEMVQRVERKPGGYQEWRHVLALIQIAGGDLSVVIDPVRVRDLTPLRPLMAGKARKIFLGGGQDAALLDKSGIGARNIADVGEMALALFGRREDGMAALADRIFGLSLDKTIRRADWIVRPLNPVLISYAHRDAELTLLIYRWFEHHHPDVLRFHQRREFDPGLSPDAAEWLRESLSRSGIDPAAILMELHLEPERDGERLASDIRVALREATAPRLINRLIRTGSDLGLADLLPDIEPYLQSPSSMLRMAAARAVGQLSTPEVGKELLEQLTNDPLEEVRRTAETAMRELQSPAAEHADEEPEDEISSIGGNALAALQALKSQLEAD